MIFRNKRNILHSECIYYKITCTQKKHRQFESYMYNITMMFSSPMVHHMFGCIKKTCPCNEYPRKPHFYMGYAGVYLSFLLFFCPKHRLWVLVRTASVLCKTIKKNLMKFSISTAQTILCLLHGQVVCVCVCVCVCGGGGYANMTTGKERILLSLGIFDNAPCISYLPCTELKEKEPSVVIYSPLFG